MFLQFTEVKVSQINDIRYESLKAVLSQFGGLYTALVSPLLFALSPFLYRSFLKQVVGQLKKKQDCKHASLDCIQFNLKERVSYIGIYDLYDRIERLEREDEDHGFSKVEQLEIQMIKDRAKLKELERLNKQLEERVNRQDQLTDRLLRKVQGSGWQAPIEQE